MEDGKKSREEICDPENGAPGGRGECRSGDERRESTDVQRSGLESLCRKIQMPEEVTELLCGSEELTGGLEHLREHLEAARKAKERYDALGIPEDIYFDTMGVFSRFVREYQESFGSFGFDREWWTCRQTGLKLFRIGELEYEMTEEDGEKVISVHIPSDARLAPELCQESYGRAELFFERYFPEYADCSYICDSWLLSPYLRDLLDENSKILKFQQEYEIRSVDPESREYMQWLFRNRDADLSEVPQTTSLQRRAKYWLEAGGKIGSAFGVLKRKNRTSSETVV